MYALYWPLLDEPKEKPDGKSEQWFIYSQPLPWHYDLQYKWVNLEHKTIV